LALYTMAFVKMSIPPQKKQGAIKRQLLIPCDLYNNIKRCTDSESGYTLVKGACKETNMILILNKINKYSQLYNRCSFLQLSKRYSELVTHPNMFYNRAWTVI
jgi:hypothetical protein